MLLDGAPFTPCRPSDSELYVSASAAAVFGPSMEGLWAMLSAYFDDSGSHRESTVCVMAGVIATPAGWEALTQGWVKALEHFGVPDFHASDCAAGGGNFKGWPVEHRNDLYARVAKLTRQYVAFRTWTAVYMEDYRANFRAAKKETLPVSLCAMGCASQLRTFALKRDIYIPCVFDQAPKAGRIYRSFEDLIRKRRHGFYRMGMMSKGDRLMCPPLQAADLVAYETYRYFSDQLAGRHWPRKWFREVQQVTDIGGYFMNADKLNMLGRGLRAQKADDDPVPIPPDYLTPTEGLRITRLAEPEPLDPIEEREKGEGEG